MTLPLAPFSARSGLRGMVAAADQLAVVGGRRHPRPRWVGGRCGSRHGDRHGGRRPAPVRAGRGRPGHGRPARIGRPRRSCPSGAPGAGSDPARMRAEGMAVMPLRGDIRSVQVPGAVDGWLALHERYGRLPLDEVLAPAIELASEGFAASIMLALASHLVHALPGAGELCPGGPLEVGQRVRLPGIARTLRAIAREGRAGFYGGEFGRGLLQLGGGHFAPADVATSAADLVRATAPACVGPRPVDGATALAGLPDAGGRGGGRGQRPRDRPGRCAVGPPAGGVVARRRPRPPRRALRRGRRGRAPRIPSASTPPWPGWNRTGRRHPTSRRVAGLLGPAVARLADGDTTHLCALDADGLGVSLTQSNALDFGSHLVEPATGVFLHNRGVGFSLVAGHPAEVAPGRRPPHTLSPMLVTTPDGALTHLVGAMGGDAQPQIIVQLLARLLHSGQDPATAVSAPRLTLDAPAAGPFRLWWGDDLTVVVEADAPPGWRGGLAAHGHRVRTIRAFDPVAVGCAQIIAVQQGRPGDATPGRGVGPAQPRGRRGGSLATPQRARRRAPRQVA